MIKVTTKKISVVSWCKVSQDYNKPGHIIIHQEESSTSCFPNLPNHVPFPHRAPEWTSLVGKDEENYQIKWGQNIKKTVELKMFIIILEKLEIILMFSGKNG